MGGRFATEERIRRLLSHARRAEAEGRTAVAKNFVRMARDLRPAAATRRPLP